MHLSIGLQNELSVMLKYFGFESIANDTLEANNSKKFTHVQILTSSILNKV